MMNEEHTMLWLQMNSPLGPLTLCRNSQRQAVAHIEFGSFTEREAPLRQWAQRWFPGAGASAWREARDCVLLGEAAAQLQRYFNGQLQSFTVPLDLQGTAFQRRVWQELLSIPYGEVRSYKQIAEAAGNPRAVRAVGGANNRNPVPIIVPCHRVIGADGSMVGYGGGMDIKVHLLRLENVKTSVV